MENVVEDDYRLFGCGALTEYGSYKLAVADSIGMAYEILSKLTFNDWKKDVDIHKRYAKFDEDGNPLNLATKEIMGLIAEGFFEMTYEEQLDYFKSKHFKIDQVVDLKTNVWDDEHA